MYNMKTFLWAIPEESHQTDEHTRPVPKSSLLRNSKGGKLYGLKHVENQIVACNWNVCPVVCVTQGHLS